MNKNNWARKIMLSQKRDQDLDELVNGFDGHIQAEVALPGGEECKWVQAILLPQDDIVIYNGDPYALAFAAKAGGKLDLDAIIHVEKNPADADHKYSAWFNTWSCPINGDDPEKVKEAALDLADVIIESIADNYLNNRNYGLAFCACGYDGQAQTDFIKHYADEYNVEVF